MQHRAASSRSAGDAASAATPGKHTRVDAIAERDAAAPASAARPSEPGAPDAATSSSPATPQGGTIQQLFGRHGDRHGTEPHAAEHGAGEADADVDDSEASTPANRPLVAGKPPGAHHEIAFSASPRGETARVHRHRPLSIQEATARYAPLVFLAPGETHRPSDPSLFIKNSRLRWSHDSGQSDDEIADQGHVDARKLGNGGYSDQVQDLLGRKHGDPIRSNQDVRPKDGKGDGGDEGFFLDLDNAHHESAGPGTQMPVYYEAVAGHYITYWFFYAYNQGPAPGGIDNHEGDWERISIKLNQHNRATAVAYYQHTGHEIKRWREVPKQGSHPLVFSAKGSHASYDSPGDKDLGVPLGLVKDHAGRGAQWKTWQHMKNARAQAWYGYGGAWGEVGDLSDTTGPQGPSRYKPPAPEGW